MDGTLGPKNDGACSGDVPADALERKQMRSCIDIQKTSINHLERKHGGNKPAILGVCTHCAEFKLGNQKLI